MARAARVPGAYKNYAGELDHCLLEKALEHFLSVVLAAPKPGMTAVDIGSCTSVAPAILRRVYGVRCLEQDLEYPAGVHGDRVGSSADCIPLDNGSVDFMTLHCTFEHFEGGADSGFVAECARLLSPSGRVVILPLYLNATHCNVTGITDPAAREGIEWDADAEHYCEVPEWQNRFGRHYSVRALLDRVIAPAIRAGLKPRLIKVVNWGAVHASLWLRWVLILEQGAPATATHHAPPNPWLREVRLLQSEIKSLHERLDAQVADSEARLHECNLLAAQLAELREQFAVVEADRVARGQVIEAQGRRTTEVEALVFLTEQNRDWHRNEAERLGAQLALTEQNRDWHRNEAERLGGQLALTEQNRDRHRNEAERLGAQLAAQDEHIARTSSRWWFRLGRRLKLL